MKWLNEEAQELAPGLEQGIRTKTFALIEAQDQKKSMNKN